MFTTNSHAIIYGRHTDVTQRMLDFDFLSGRSPSVAGIIDPTIKGIGNTKIFFGDKEILIPIYPNLSAIPAHVEFDTLLNFASFRSASQATWEGIKSERFAHIVIIAEGIPEREIREIIAYNEHLPTDKKVRIIGPATAGALAGGAFRLGNNGGSLENIVASRLYQKGSVGFVSRSGGMSNEMYRVISKRTDGIHTGIALGGDRFVCSTFRDIVLAYEAHPEISMIVLLGEVGSQDELEVAELLQNGLLKKPLVAHIAGSFAEMLATEVQFGHAGAKANADAEKASYKNNALRKAGAYVSENYADFGDMIAEVFSLHCTHAHKEVLGKNTKHGKIGAEGGKSSPSSPEDSHILSQKNRESDILDKLKKIQTRKSTKFTSTISDERGEELLYNKKPISEYVAHGSIARVIGALWLKQDIPQYAADFINTILILLADHGPAVAGATNTMVTARAGKDILSSLVSGLLTIGPRFGGAIDGAARCLHDAVRQKERPLDFVERMKKSGNPIPGIGHKVKSKFNPDSRCELLRQKARQYGIWEHGLGKHLSYALEVEALTLEKKPNLILNVDGHIAAILLDIFEAMGMSAHERDMYIEAGIFNAFFILARSIGFIGHALDQKRLGEHLHRTGWEDIYYGE